MTFLTAKACLPPLRPCQTDVAWKPTALLDNIKVTMAGSTFPLKQAAQVSVKNNNTLIVACFDPDVSRPDPGSVQGSGPSRPLVQTAAAALEAIQEADVAPNPVREELTIKVQMPLYAAGVMWKWTWLSRANDEDDKH